MFWKSKVNYFACAALAVCVTASLAQAQVAQTLSVDATVPALGKDLRGAPRATGMSMDVTPIDRSNLRISGMGSPRGLGCPMDAEIVHNGVDYAVDADLGNFGSFPASSLLGGSFLLGGTNRQLCQIQHVSINLAPAPIDTSVILRIHAGCPAVGDAACDGAPLLFEDTFAFTGVPTGIVVLDFDLPGVVVPDNIHISVEYTDANLGWIAADFPPDPALMPQPPAYIGAPVTGGWTFCGPASSGNFACDLFSAGGTGAFGEAIFQVLAVPAPENGACCDTRTGMCTEVLTIDDCVVDARDLFFNNFFPGATCETLPVPCDMSAFVQACDMMDTLEGETVCTEADEYNSGCFSDLDPVNGAFNAPPLPIGGTVCGTTGLVLTADGMAFAADNDWYKLEITDLEAQVSLTIQSEVEVLFGIIDTGGVDTCPATFPFVGGGLTSPAGATTVVSECLTQGTWYVIVQPTGGDANLGLCAGDFTYRLTTTTVPSCIVVSCPAGSSGQISDLQGQGGAGTLGVISDLNRGNAVAENFSPQGNATLESITVFGAFFEGAFLPCSDGATGTPGDDDYTVTYFLSNPVTDLPGVEIASFSVTATETPTGRNLAGLPEVEVTAAHPPVDVSSQNCFWVEFTNNTTGCAFLILTAPPGDAISIDRDPGTEFDAADTADHDMAICLDTNIAIDGCTSAIEFTGACCLPFGPCQETSFTNCANQNGIFAGPATVCGVDTDCTGACCVPDLDMGLQTGTATCQILTYQNCMTVAGGNFFAFLGVGTDCADSPCATGSCCLRDGGCRDFASFGIITHRPNCAPQYISNEPGNFFDRSLLSTPFNLTNGEIGGFTEGGACSGLFPDTACPQPSVFNAFDVGCNDSVTYNNAGLGAAGNANNGLIDQPDHTCFGGASAEGNGAYWLTFTASNLQTEVSACATTAVNDTVLSVYTSTSFNPAGDIGGPNGADFEVACNDDAADPCNGDDGNFNAEVCIDTVPGQQYWVQVSSFTTADQGEITITVTCADDACTAAPTCATCTSDIDGDNDRDGADIQAFANELISPTPNLCADTDNSGTIDLGDIANFVSEVLAGGTCP